MQPKAPPTDSASFDARQVRLIKIGIGAVVVLAIAVLAYFLVREKKTQDASARWDEFARIQQLYGPQSPVQDPLFEGPADPYRARRGTYIEKLEEFLEQDGVTDDKALAPHVHWLVAKLSADQAISDKDDLDVAKRSAAWGRAIEHVKVLRDDYPDFQTNWQKFAPAGEASLTKRFLYTLEANAKWEKDHFPRAIEPAEDVVVVFRTDRGDLRMGLYSEQAPDLTTHFVERVVAGDYDGTAFSGKADTEQGGRKEHATIRGGHPASRGARPYDREQHVGFVEREQEDPLLPAPTRWLLPIDRGLVVAWHEPADDYEGPQQILIAADRSPILDYRYSPIGKVLGDDSLATLDRIFESKTWRDDLTVDTSTDEGRRVADLLQAPVKIVKALVYDAEGNLREPASGGSEHRAATEESERRLADLQKDAYLTEAPKRPVAPPPDDAPEEEAAPEDGESPEAPPADDDNP